MCCHIGLGLSSVMIVTCNREQMRQRIISDTSDYDVLHVAWPFEILELKNHAHQAVLSC